jgi:hypothetical protein
MTAMTTESTPPHASAAEASAAEARAVAHAEAVWHILSEAVDRTPGTERLPFLIRLVLLTGLDQESAERFADLVAEAEATA